MENMKKKTMALMAMIGTGAYMGYQYLMKHPEMKNKLKQKAKCATKKLYEKLDDMD